MKRVYCARVLMCAVAMGFVACATTASSRHREGDNTGQEISITPAEESQMTQEVLPQMRKDFPAAPDTKLQEYISGVGKKLVTANKLEGNPYHYTFTIVESDMVNAFALPAGTVFVTLPLLKNVENEAELAGVLGHEIGHVVARHTAERMDAQKKGKTKSILQSVGGGILGGVVGFGAGKLLCKSGDTACLAKATVGGAALGVGGSLLLQKYSYMANSREDEMEADRIGFRVATKAGYSKDHVGAFYAKLLKMEEQSKGQQSGMARAFSDAMSTHPPSRERVQQMGEMAQTSQNVRSPVVSTPAFADAKNRALKLELLR